MKIFIAIGTHYAHPTELRRYCATLPGAREAAVGMVNLLRRDIDRDRLPPVPPVRWDEGLLEAQRRRLAQLDLPSETLDTETIAAEAGCDVQIIEAVLEAHHLLPALDDRELATILAALRLLQEQGCPDHLTDIATEGFSLDTMADDEIDALCERLNIGDTPHMLPHIVVAIDGGLVSGVVADRAVIMRTVDYDTEGAADEEVTLVPQDDRDPVEAIVGCWSDDAVLVDPDWITALENVLTNNMPAEDA
jgi:hypothetical protein